MGTSEVLADYGDLCAESRLWDRVHKQVYWTDITGKRFFRRSLQERKSKAISEGFKLAVFAIQDNGAFEVNTNSFKLWDGAGKKSLIADEVDTKRCALSDCQV
jgi:sugar lactone lactonase YvrE